MTAVEWLVEELKELGALNIDGLHWSDQDDVKKSITKAKEMEKEQIIDAHYAEEQDGEQYYNQTFKSE